MSERKREEVFHFFKQKKKKKRAAFTIDTNQRHELRKRGGQ